MTENETLRDIAEQAKQLNDMTTEEAYERLARPFRLACIYPAPESPLQRIRRFIGEFRGNVEYWWAEWKLRH